MNARAEWFVEGPNLSQWIAAKDGDEACERYIARYRLPYHLIDELVVLDVRRAVEPKESNE